jgi:hypothetical protein
MLQCVALLGELEGVAARAAAYGTVLAVLPAEPQPDLRAYLIALDSHEQPRWLVLDRQLEPVDLREQVRDVAAVVVLCELAGELAGGGNLAELLERLAALGEEAAGEQLEQARVAAHALAHEIGVPPIVASPGYLDRVGMAAVRLERTLGEQSSPLAAALAAHTYAVERFVEEVVERSRLPLR